MKSFADVEDAAGGARPQARLRFELLFASLWLAVGLFLLPALVYAVGVALLGPYGDQSADQAGLGTFYTVFFGDLAGGSGQAWALALGPVMLAWLVRAVFIGVRSGETSEEKQSVDDEPRRRADTRRQPGRLEPRVSLD